MVEPRLFPALSPFYSNPRPNSCLYYSYLRRLVCTGQVYISIMDKPTSILPIWAEYTQIKEFLTLKKAQPASPHPTHPEPRFSLDLDRLSDFPSLKQSLYNSPSLSLSGSFSAGRQTTALSALQDTVAKLKGDVERLRSGGYRRDGKLGSWGSEGRYSEGRDKATQVVVSERQKLMSQSMSRMESESEASNRTSDEEDISEWVERHEGTLAPTTSFYIPFHDEKPYQYLSESKGIPGWVVVKMKGGQFRTREGQTLRLSGSQRSDMYLSADGISGGFRVCTRTPHCRRLSERILKVKAFGHCVVLTEGEMLCSGVHVNKQN